MLTEAFEASKTKGEALRRLTEMVKLYRKGEETMSVIDMYEIAAMNHGADYKEIQAAWRP